MPPRKSNISTISTTADESNGVQVGKERDGINIEDLSMPRTMIQRLAKGVLPPNTQIQKDAITAFTKAATLFVSYLSHNAHAHTYQSQRKTITPADVFLGLRDAEFEALLPRLEAELDRYNQVQTSKRNEYRKKVREGTMGAGPRKSAGGDAPRPNAEGEHPNSGEGPVAKRARLEQRGKETVAGAAGGEEVDGDETVDEDAGEDDGGEEEGGEVAEGVEEEGEEGEEEGDEEDAEEEGDELEERDLRPDDGDETVDEESD